MRRPAHPGTGSMTPDAEERDLVERRVVDDGRANAIADASIAAVTATLR